MTSRSNDGGPTPARDPSEFPPPIYNWMSLTGFALAIVSITGSIFFVLIGLVTGGDSGYGGLVFLLPAGSAVLSFVLIVAGWLRERRRHKHGRHSSFLERSVFDPSAALRDIGPLAIATGIAVGTFGLLWAAAASVAMVEFTESNMFCGEVCHQVMRPEATVYVQSPHAKIACVDCHVGPGGDSYIRSKVSGLRQVYAFTTGEIQRPIPTPIRHRRPSHDMCESCHTADRFNGYKALSRAYFLNGQESRPLKLRMLVDVGGPHSLKQGSGIHYHMMFERKVEYIARDRELQDIPWVRVTQPDGHVEVFANEDEPLTEAERESLPVRPMECVDCHSRPAHVFPSAVDSVNAALETGVLPSGIPYIKEAAVRSLDGGYDSLDGAMQGIEENLFDFYEEEHPDEIDGDGKNALKTSVSALRDIYRRTIFPSMKADWAAHPNNAGHRDTPGCFRCHNEEMVSEEGNAIFTDCNRCHQILAQGEGKLEVTSNFEEGLAFVHPEDWETLEDFTLCSDCHTGGADLYD